MTPQIERVRYYDGEYLRAFDFTADQAYHVEMRRRLNMSLHLYGIVEGLQLQDTSDASTGISQVSITSGMAIDPFGREIFLLAPYTLDDVADVNANRITVSQIYRVWIQYIRIAETPPSVGYAACDATAQNTRWLESFKIVLLKQTTATNPIPPGVTDDISEEETPDPDTSNGVLLGLVYVAPGSTMGGFSLKDPRTKTLILQPDLSYIGLRAQNIQPPDFDKTSPAVSALDASNPLVAPLGVEVQSNLSCDQNLIVGQDFAVSLKPNAGPPAFPSPTGNLKVASDLFLQGNLYSILSGAWLNLAQLIAALAPDVIVRDIVVFSTTDPSSSPPAKGSDTLNFTVTSSRLKNIANATVSATIASFQTDTRSNLRTNFGDYQVSVDLSIPSPPTPSGNTCSVSVHWSISPSTGTGATFMSGILQLKISCVVVCYPS